MSRRIHAPRAQRGAALAIVLVLLVVMTLLGLAGMRMTLLQERMNANVYDRSLYFQSAEAAVREAELVAQNLDASTMPGTGVCNASGLCGFPNPTAAPVWEDNANWASYGKVVTTDFGPAVVGQPRYLIELLANKVPIDVKECSTYIDISATECGGTAKRYRITVKSPGVAVAGRGQVMLQSIFIDP